MSDNAIRVGDLVMIVRPDCASSAAIVGGRIGKVESIGFVPKNVDLFCDGCGRRYALAVIATVGNIYPPLSWLRKIPPLWELDETERKIEEPTC